MKDKYVSGQNSIYVEPGLPPKVTSDNIHDYNCLECESEGRTIANTKLTKVEVAWGVYWTCPHGTMVERLVYSPEAKKYMNDFRNKEVK